jgi:hypothetical protein
VRRPPRTRRLLKTGAQLLGGSPADAQRLHALIDGLALHAVLDTATTTPARQRELLAAELDAIGR